MVKEDNSKAVKLKVAEAMQEDTYKGIVRIDSGVMKELGIRPGSVVKIESKDKSSVALVDRALPSDMDLPIIRMDALIRRNAGTSIGEMVFVKPIEAKEAKSVVLAPAQKGVIVQGHPMAFTKALLGRPVMKGDVISLGGAPARRRTMSGSPFEEIFNMFGEDFVSGALGGFGLGNIRFVVVSASPNEAVLITQNTEIEMRPEAVKIKESRIPDVAYEDIGGLGDEISKVREMIEIPLKHPEVFERLGVQPPKGVLLRGPPGTGKTLIAKAVASESGANFISINGPEIVSKFVGEAEKNIRNIFDEAEKNAPSIIFIDEIDAIAPKREESYGEVERRIVAQLLASMDGLKGRGKVIVIAATNRPDSLDPALRRGGRFDREIEIGVPNREGRLEILKIHTRNMPLVGVKLDELVDRTHGFVGADIETLCKEAAMCVLRRILPELNAKEDTRVSDETLSKLTVTKEDFREALKVVTPSAMREVLIETPNVSWADIGDLEEAKQSLKESVEWPLKHGASFTRMGIKPPRGILLYGPPGCGKTLLVKATAKESDANFISVKGPELLSKWVGESEKGIRQIFQRARQVAPAIVFFDELDALAPKRGAGCDSGVTERVVSQLLTEIDGIEELNDVVVIAATNRPELVDVALLRPGRFDRHIYIGAPSDAGRKEILKLHTKGMPLTKDVNLNELAKKLKNYSGADIKSLCTEAAMIALRENLNADKINKHHFDEALKKVKASLDEADVKRFKDLTSGLPARLDYMG